MGNESGNGHELREILEVAGIPWPEPSPHVAGGARFSRVTNVNARSEDQLVHYLPPPPPSREVPDPEEPDLFDEEGEPIGRMRRLTDAEWAAALARHEDALADWHRTGGMHVVKGRRTLEATFILETGGFARGVYASGGGWTWIEWSYP